MKRWLMYIVVVALLTVLVIFQNIYIGDVVSPQTLLEAYRATPPVDANIDGMTVPAMLLLYEYEEESILLADNIRQTLAYMDIQLDVREVVEAPDSFEKYAAVIYATYEMSGYFDCIQRLMAYANAGGHLMFAGGIGGDTGFMAISQALGIMEISTEQWGAMNATSVSISHELLPVNFRDGILSGPGVETELVPMSLYPDVEVFMYGIESEGERRQVPLMWRREYGQGQIMVSNSDFMIHRAMRSWIAGSICVMMDGWIYPILNSLVMFIDDFPAPLSEAAYHSISAEYGRDTPVFFRDVWWPDMQEMASDYDIKYTGMMIESYNANVVPPFLPNSRNPYHKGFSQWIVSNGGEVGIHGYNHNSLLTPAEYAQVPDPPLYDPWEYQANMEASIVEVQRFGKTLLQDYHFASYVPPSNLLQGVGLQAVINSMPDLYTICALYNTDESGLEYMQELDVDQRGIVNLPRMSSGLYMDEEMEWSMINGMAMHGLVSHFMHPDDIMDDHRNNGMGWRDLKTSFDSMLAMVRHKMPSLRAMTATQAAIEVEKSTKQQLYTHWEAGRLRAGVTNFVQDASFFVRIPGTITALAGCTAVPMSGSYYLLVATQPNFEVTWE